MLQMSGESFRRLLVKVRKMRLVLYSGMRALELMLLPCLAGAFILGSPKCSANERQEMKYQGGQNLTFTGFSQSRSAALVAVAGGKAKWKKFGNNSHHLHFAVLT